MGQRRGSAVRLLRTVRHRVLLSFFMGKIKGTLFPFTDISSGMKPSAATSSVLQRHPGSALFLRKVPKMPCFCGFYGVGSNEPNDEPSGFKRRG